MVLGKIILIFSIVLIGFGASKIGWLPLNSSKYLAKVVINIAAPCVVIKTISDQEFRADVLQALLIVSALYLAQYIFQYFVALILRKVLNVNQSERGVFTNFYLFTNNGFMGFPVCYAIFGSQGMFYIVIVNILMPFFLYTHGIWNVKKDAAAIDSTDDTNTRKLGVFEFLTPPIMASFVALIIYFLNIPIHPLIDEMLDILGSMMTPLSMMVIGIQLTESNPRRLMLNSKLLITSLMRVLFMPAVFVCAAILIGLDPLMLGVLTLNIMLPCAAMPVALAEDFGADATLAAEGNFLSTLFSMVTIPVAVAVYGLFI